MRKTQLEIADPASWLIQLAEDATGYYRLVHESGGMARAAYRLARARCSGEAPCLEDLQAAAAALAANLGGQVALPIRSLLPSAPPPSSAVPSSGVVPSVAPASGLVGAARSLPPPAPSSRRQPKSRPHVRRVSP